MKLHLHDFAGHPFQVELSNKLAKRGFSVHHSYFAHSREPKGLFQDTESSGNIIFHKIVLKQRYSSHSLIKRLFFELNLSLRLLWLHFHTKPDLTIVANTPLLSAFILMLFTPRHKFILWHQDVISRAFKTAYSSNSNVVNFFLNFIFEIVEKIERWIYRRSAAVVCIAREFLDVYRSWNEDIGKVKVIENWAPLNQISYLPSQFNGNEWNLIYAGTLGMKHNPSLLLDFIRLAEVESLNCKLLVISEGDGAKFLHENRQPEDRLKIIDFVSLRLLEKHLTYSNVALVILEEDASTFSVPSKSYSYLAAGRFVIALAPSANAACRAILEAGGKVFPPTVDGVRDAIGFLKNLSEAKLRIIESSARDYAETNFNADVKAQKFESIIRRYCVI